MSDTDNKKPAPVDATVEHEAGSVVAGAILLVDDSDVVRVFTCKILEISGYKVLSAGSPEEAIRLCESEVGKIDLLLTDVAMPGMNGRQLFERVRHLRPAMKVLFMSGYTDDSIMRDGVLLAGVQFIQKPFSQAAMAKKVFEVLNAGG
jgi:CheY-like chemotaxis protein